MVEQQVTITKGLTTDEAIVQKFKATFRGELIRPEDAGYDEARKIWNGMIDKYPTLIAGCTGAGCHQRSQFCPHRVIWCGRRGQIPNI